MIWHILWMISVLLTLPWFILCCRIWSVSVSDLCAFEKFFTVDVWSALQITVKSSWWLFLYNLKEGPSSSPFTCPFLREVTSTADLNVSLSLSTQEEYACFLVLLVIYLASYHQVFLFSSPSRQSPGPSHRWSSFLSQPVSILFTHFCHFITQQIFIKWLLHARLRIMS